MTVGTLSPNPYQKLIIENLTIPANYICALREFAGKDDIRTQLNGVLLELGASEYRMVATDGLIVGVLRGEHSLTISAPTLKIFVPLTVLKNIKTKGAVSISVVEHVDGGAPSYYELTVNYDGANAQCEVPAGTANTYPKWRRLFNNTATDYEERTATIDGKLLSRITKVASLLSTGKHHPIRLCMRGADMVLVKLPSQHFIAGLMPLREADSKSAMAEVDTSKQATWVLDDLSTPKDSKVENPPTDDFEDLL